MYAVVGILFLLIIVIAGWLIAFNNLITAKKDMIDHTWDRLSLLLIKRNELLEKLAQRADIANSSLEPLVLARNSLKEAETTAQLIRYSLELSNQVQTFLSALKADLIKDKDAEWADLLLPLAELEEGLHRQLELYQELVISYDSRMKVFPNNLAAVILGAQPLGEKQGGERQ